MVKKYGIDTDEQDDETYEAAKGIIDQQVAEEWSTEKLLEKYENLRSVVLENMPNQWPGLEFALSVKTILNIKDCTLPFTGIILGPASSLKMVIIECFRGYEHTFYSDNFSPKSFVSHISGKTEEQLLKVYNKSNQNQKSGSWSNQDQNPTQIQTTEAIQPPDCKEAVEP